MRASVVDQLVREFAPQDQSVGAEGDYALGDEALDVSRFFVAWRPAQLEGIIRKPQDGGAYVAYLGKIEQRMQLLLGLGLKDLRGFMIRFAAPTWRFYSWGVCERIARGIGITGSSPVLQKGAEADYKIVTFAPAKDVPVIREALFGAGAGRYGLYSKCSFSGPGRGTFYGEKGSKPTYGKAGKLEDLEEERLEVFVPFERLGRAVAALQKVHPYEEPVIDTYEIKSERRFGEGRIGSLATPSGVSELVRKMAAVLGSQPVYVSGNPQVDRAMIWDGDPREGLHQALASGVGLYVGPNSDRLCAFVVRAQRTAVVEFPEYCFTMTSAKELVYMIREKSRREAWGMKTFLPSRVGKEEAAT